MPLAIGIHITTAKVTLEWNDLHTVSPASAELLWDDLVVVVREADLEWSVRRGVEIEVSLYWITEGQGGPPLTGKMVDVPAFALAVPARGMVTVNRVMAVPTRAMVRSTSPEAVEARELVPAKSALAVDSRGMVDARPPLAPEKSPSLVRRS